jgi:protocatechuate 3,4-dioxygenase beta subunit
VKLKGKKDLVSQCYIKGHPGNERDGIWKQLAATKQENLVTIDFAPLPGSTANELAAKWDVVLGVTPEHG